MSPKLSLSPCSHLTTFLALLIAGPTAPRRLSHWLSLSPIRVLAHVPSSPTRRFVLPFLAPAHPVFRPRPSYGVAAHLSVHIARSHTRTLHSPTPTMPPSPPDRTDHHSPALPPTRSSHHSRHTLRSPLAHTHSLRRRMPGWRLREAPTLCVIPIRKLAARSSARSPAVGSAYH
ncbi:hypothetical protein FB45DRAFT_1112018 [Roridomyces roridus]|uniref:Uncharacterized protein n=1 Tax=Roridomyces roridus TaxID=1738132 RepID=A0AAD7FE78_9AGAR|nr:hypothetical protein FB45DRAFT_1112018 [Roridomyces roridus]